MSTDSESSKTSRLPKCKALCGLGNFYKTISCIYNKIENFDAWVSSGRPFFKNCFFGLLSLRFGNHIVFLSVLVSSVIAMILNYSAYVDVTETFKKMHSTQHYAEMLIDGISTIVAILYIYGYTNRNRSITKLVFYWLLASALIHVIWFLQDSGSDSELATYRLLHIILGAVFLYLDLILVSWIQMTCIAHKLSAEHHYLLEEWDHLELLQQIEEDEGDHPSLPMNQVEKVEGNHPGLRMNQIEEDDNTKHVNSQGHIMQGSTDRESSDRRRSYIESRDWRRSLDFQSKGWDMQEIEYATWYNLQYNRKYMW